MTAYILLVGWPKCGTSSTFSWLAHHPAISASEPKETFFLMDPDHPLSGRHGAFLDRDGPASYDRFFRDGPDSVWRMDATTHYAFQKTALDFAKSLGPDVHVIFTLRDPAKRLRSSFEYTRNNLAQISGSLDFETYAEILLAGEPDRLDAHVTDAESLWILKRELDYGAYWSWMEPWVAALDPSQRSCILFEDMTRNPDQEIRRIIRALGLPEDAYDGYDYPRRNETVAIRNTTAQRLARKVNRILPAGQVKGLIKSAYVSAFTRKKPQTAAPDLDALSAYYAPHNARLAEKLSLDLSAWAS